ncbi:MAG: hypothetical protein IJF92_05855 [Bacilli bacterium]|nr:hypothetical protein [Bacilli bacterium]
MKKLKYLVFVLIFTFLCTGCVKFNANMDIKKDKSMDFSIIYALDSTYFGNKQSVDKKNQKELKEKGYKIEDYSKDKMKGVKITKTFKNIDKISSNKNVNYSLSGLTEGKNKNDYVFKVKKGLFKNHYIAKFDFNMGDSSASNGSTDISNYPSSMDLSYNVTLPYKAIKNNATKVNKNKTKLSWDLTKNTKDKIEFEFELYNTCTIIIFVVLVIVIIAGVGVTTFFIINNKKKDNKKEVK